MGFRALINVNTSEYFEVKPSLSDGVVIRVSDEFNPVSYQGFRIPPGSDTNVRMRDSNKCQVHKVRCVKPTFLSRSGRIWLHISCACFIYRYVINHGDRFSKNKVFRTLKIRRSRIRISKWDPEISAQSVR